MCVILLHVWGWCQGVVSVCVCVVSFGVCVPGSVVRFGPSRSRVG